MGIGGEVVVMEEETEGAGEGVVGAQGRRGEVVSEEAQTVTVDPVVGDLVVMEEEGEVDMEVVVVTWAEEDLTEGGPRGGRWIARDSRPRLIERKRCNKTCC